WDAARRWTRPFRPEGIEEHPWETLERMGNANIDPAEGREHSARFREFARRLKDRLIRNYLMRPIYSDTAELLLELLKKSPVEPKSVVPVPALDQYPPPHPLTPPTPLSPPPPHSPPPSP